LAPIPRVKKKYVHYVTIGVTKKQFIFLTHFIIPTIGVGLAVFLIHTIEHKLELTGIVALAKGLEIGSTALADALFD
jgi:hypothetical protein